MEKGSKFGDGWTVLAALGVAEYRAGNWTAAGESLQRSLHSTCFTDGMARFFLAMAYWRLDRQDDARECYQNAVEWMDQNRPDDEELLRIRAEAEGLIAPR